MPGFQSLAARALAQPPQNIADGGAVGFGARGVAGLRDMIPKIAAMGYPQAAPAAAPAAQALAAPPRSPAGLRAVIPQVEAMGYQQAAAQPPQYFANGGVVRGPGTGTSDDIETEVPPGTFIMPADSTDAIGPSALEQMGTVPVRLSDGEFEMPPEQVMALGAAVLKAMKDATHTPVNGQDGGQTDAELASPAGFQSAEQRMAAPPQMFADGGIVGAVQDPQFRRDVGRGLLDVANRGVAATLGAPVDLAATAMGALGYKHDAPVMGSEWIGRKMESAGMVTPERRPVAEALASVAGPAAGMKAARGVGRAVEAAAANMSPSPGAGSLAAQRGAVLVGEGRAAQPAMPNGTAVQMADPASLTYREAMQNRLGDVRSMFPGDEYFPAVVINDGKGRTILDGHNRATVAAERGHQLPVVDLSAKEYQALKAGGYDDTEAAYAALVRARQEDAASGLAQQFPGANLHQRGMAAWQELPDQIQGFADGGLVDPARRPNSFGDAAAVARDPSITQVNTGGADTFGRPAPAPAPRPAGFQSAAARMASTGDPTNPYAANNAAVLSNFAQQQGSRGIVEMGRAPAPQPPTARNSFGDAAAATVDPMTTQVAYTPGAPAPAASQVASTPAAPVGLAASARLASPAPATPAPPAPMGWAERNAQRNAEVSAASITNRPEWSRAPAGLARRAYADGGLVDDEQRQLAQIPTGGQQAPAADGSQANPLNTDVGRNVVNTLSALPGATGLAARGGAPAARAAGGAMSVERAAPATWELVEGGGALANRAAAPAAQQMAQLPSAGGPLARAANMAPQQAAPALAGPGGQLAPAGASQAARGATEFVERVPDAAISMSQSAAPAGLAARAGGGGVGRYATGAAGLGAAAMLAGATPDTGAAPTQPAGFAPGALAAPAQAPTSAAAAMSQPPSTAPAGITRTGNSYTGPANITGDVTINGAAPGGGAISAQNMAAADTLAGRQAQESAARVLGQMPAGFPAAVQAPTVLHSGNDWQSRNDLRNALVSASSIMNNGGPWDRHKGESAESLTYRAMLGNDIAARGAGPRLAAEAMKETGENNRAAMKVAGDLQGENIRAQGLTMKAVIDARRSGQPPAGYQWTGNGGLTHIPGGPADPSVRGNKAPLNDVQSKALQFGTRMQEAGSVIDRLAAAGVNQPGLIKRGADAVGLGGLANFTQSAEQQQVEQAQRDFINAVLRRESGAAIADSEFSNANKQYFIQPGDSAEVQAQKRRNREIATAGILAEVPDSEKRVGQVLQAAGNNAPAQPGAAPAGPAAAAPAAPPQIAELQRRAANNPALAARLKELGY